MKMPIAIIDCAVNTPSYNCMNKLSEQFNRPFSYHWVSTHGTNSLDLIKEASAYIIFGSDTNVSDRLPWQTDLQRRMKEKILNGIPVLGICFGHQLMADAFGAKIDLVTPDNKCYEGIRSHKVINTKFGFTQGETLTTIVTHHYEVKNLPEDFIHLSSSDICKYDGLAHKELPFLSFQGHPEASHFFINDHLDKPLSEVNRQAGLLGGSKIIRKFLELVDSKS